MSDPSKKALVIGGGVAGMEAAAKIGQAGYRVYLVEKEDVLGGVLRQLYSSFPHWDNPQDLLENVLTQVEKNSHIKILTGTEVTAARRENSNFAVDLAINTSGETKQITVDAVVLATGFQMFDASVYGEYGYGIYPKVFNSLEFEAQLKAWGSAPGTFQPPQAVAFFKCVGSRDRSKGNPYCSKICCMYTAKQAGVVKDLFPDTKAYVFYMDYRAAGKDYEEFVRSVIETKHVRYVRGRPSKVLAENGKLIVRAEDTLMGIPIEVEVDMVVLATAVVPRPAAQSLAQLFGVNTDQYGFIETDKFSPAQAGERVFVAGACGFAVETQGAQYQGMAAAAEVIALFRGLEQGGE
jgi:heterodisulfide reductase subunit A2